MVAFSGTDRLARARADLRIGLPVILRLAGERRAVLLAAERATDPWIDGLRGAGTGLYLALSEFRARTLQIRVYDGDLARIAFLGNAEAAVRIADPSRDLEHPMKGPFDTLRDGGSDPARAGLALVRDAGLLPAVLVAEMEESCSRGFAECTTLDLGLALAPPVPPDLVRTATANLPVQGAEDSRMHVFQETGTGDEHFALEVGKPARGAAPLVRVHSSCYTGDVLGSLRCDCGPQLDKAVAGMVEVGGGILVVLQQEGRGIGLGNKIRAYALQDQGFDTYEANRRLGFEEDARDFRMAAAILRALGCEAVRLLSDSPAKIEALEAGGIRVVEAVPHAAGGNPHNADYLAAKHRRRGTV